MRQPRLAALGRLSSREWRWLVASTALLPAAAVSIRCGGWAPTMERFRRWVVADRPRGALRSQPDPFAIARMVRVAATYGPYRATCLPRAVVLWSLLGRYDSDAQLRLGVRKSDGNVEAHAWVEVGGLALDERNAAADFVPLRAAIEPVL